MAAGELPTAVLAANDRNAIGVLDVFVRAGIRVPQDVSIVGYDDTELSRLAPVNLTTVSRRPPSRRRGPSPWRWNASSGTGTGATELVLPPRLVVRRTTGPPRPPT
jgi:DNA-binding LacI/PurR family transcriptional regulator